MYANLTFEIKDALETFRLKKTKKAQRSFLNTLLAMKKKVKIN